MQMCDARQMEKRSEDSSARSRDDADEELQMILDGLSRVAFELGFYDRNEMPEGGAMSEPRIKDLRHFALFLPFSCIHSRQSATYRCKTETLKAIDKTEK